MPKEKKANEKETKPPRDVENLISKIEKMSVLELHQLVKALEEKFGISAQTPVAVATAPSTTAGAEGNATDESEEKTSFDVILSEIGGNKIAVIKAVREINQNLGLKEAKDLVEAAPKPIAEGVNKEDSEKFKQKLEAAGAKVELK